METILNTSETGNTSKRILNNPLPTEAEAVNIDRLHRKRMEANKMTKKAMIEKMEALGMIDKASAKSLNRSSKERIEKIYNESVPKRLAYLASL